MVPQDRIRNGVAAPVDLCLAPELHWRMSKSFFFDCGYDCSFCQHKPLCTIALLKGTSCLAFFECQMPVQIRSMPMESLMPDLSYSNILSRLQAHA